jgi:putative transposase
MKNLVIDHPEQAWVADITYLRLQQEFIYVAVVMDVFTRSIRGWHLARSMDQSLTLTALNKGLERGHREIHYSDLGAAWQNGYAERLMRTIKEEEVDWSEYRNFTEAYQQIEQFLEDVYMKKRIHSSLDYLTPDKNESKWNEQQKENHHAKKELP